jgi:hypothetical protein
MRVDKKDKLIGALASADHTDAVAEDGTERRHPPDRKGAIRA